MRRCGGTTRLQASLCLFVLRLFVLRLFVLRLFTPRSIALRPVRLRPALSCLVLACALSGCGDAGGEQRRAPEPAPEFVGIDAWLNSEPLSMAALRGRVVLVEFWTYRCINCLNTLPQVVAWDRRYRDRGLVTIGIHTPETDEERATERVRSATRRLGIGFPVALDNGYRTWDRYGNIAWPATYVVDRRGRIVHRHYGEGNHARTEAAIVAALTEDPH